MDPLRSSTAPSAWKCSWDPSSTSFIWKAPSCVSSCLKSQVVASGTFPLTPAVPLVSYNHMHIHVPQYIHGKYMVSKRVCCPWRGAEITKPVPGSWTQYVPGEDWALLASATPVTCRDSWLRSLTTNPQSHLSPPSCGLASRMYHGLCHILIVN